MVATKSTVLFEYVPGFWASPASKLDHNVCISASETLSHLSKKWAIQSSSKLSVLADSSN